MRGRNILVTGGTGFFGRGFIQACLDARAKRICVYSRDEAKQANLRHALGDPPAMRWFIGDVRDRERLYRAMRGVDVVIHAAALKRIEVGWYNPCEMVKTNVVGAMNVTDAAADAGVGVCVLLSTDKACEPISPYGQTKALAESLFLQANHTHGNNGPAYNVTRYGNVAGSTGSVIPTWRERLKTAKVVPVSHPEATRFWMTLREAVELVTQAIHAPRGTLSIPNLPAYRLGDLAKALGAEDIQVTGLPEWEKKHESMRSGESSCYARRMTVDELREALASV